MLLILLFNGFFVVSLVQTQEVSDAKVSFQANTIPDVNVYYDDYSFVFKYKSFFIRVRPFAVYNGTYYGMKQIVAWIKNNYPNVNYTWLVDKATDAIHYGFNLTKLPQNVADKIDFLGFRLVDLNFPLSRFKLKKELFISKDGNVYNNTLIKVANKFSFSFEDLYPYGYNVQHINSTYILIGNVTGKTDLHVDPFVFSDDTIYIWGGTEGSEIDSLDIWAADNTGGWGQAEKDSSNTSFTWHCKLFWGEDENGTAHTTWFADEGVQWIFASDAPQTIMELSNHTNNHFRLGEIIDVADKIGDRGIDLITKRATYSVIVFANGSDVELYSSRFYSDNYASQFIIATTFKMYGCTLDGWIYYQQSTTAPDVYGATIKSTQYGIVSYVNVGTQENLFIHSNDYGIRLNPTSKITISDSVFRNNTKMFYSFKTTVDSNLTNINSDAWSFTWISPLVGGAEVYRQYTFDLTVFFNNGSQAENANVTIRNSYLDTSDSWLTYANGSIPQQTYSYGHYNQTGGDTIYDYNPYNLTITKDGYQTYTTLLNITEKQELIITLTLIAHPTPGTVLAVAGFAFTMSIVAVAIFIMRKKKGGEINGER